MSEVKTWKHKGETLWSGGGFGLSRHTTHTHSHAHLQRPPVHRVVVAQLLTTLILSFVLLPLGKDVALSALLGGLACSVPNAYLLWKAFHYSGARAARQIAKSFYQGEAGKFVLTATAFVLIFTLVKPIEPLALFGAFVLVQVVHWFTPMLIGR
ncbi:MAG: F0F1 ATP synthase subunit I [Endozoicomonas sp.]